MSSTYSHLLSAVKKKVELMGLTEVTAKKELVKSGVTTSSTAYRFFNGEIIKSDRLEAILEYFGLLEGIENVKKTEEGDLIIEEKDLESRPWLESLRPAIKAADAELELHILEAAATNLRRKLGKEDHDRQHDRAVNGENPERKGRVSE